MFVIEMDIGLHVLGHPSGDEPLNCRLFLGSDPLFLSIVPLPFQGKEVCETTQPLTFSLDLSLPLTETLQPVNVSSYPRISNGLYGSRHHVVHLEAFTQQVQVISSVARGYLGPRLRMKDIAINGSASSHGRVDGWLSVISFYV